MNVGSPRRTALRTAGTLLLALAAALAAEWLRSPLPWLIGPILAVALFATLGVPVHCPTALRNTGQWTIGTALGLYFTPPVIAAIASLAPALAAGVAWALFVGWLHFHWLAKASSADSEGDRATAWFAAAIGGASEMAVLGERHGGRVDRIAAAHSMRVLIVVVAIPFSLQAAGLHGVGSATPAPAQVEPLALAALCALTGAGSLALRLTGLPNPWVLGALAVALALTGLGIELSALPKALTNAGQLLIGCALGVRFTPGFLTSAPRWLAAAASGTVALLGLSAAFAWALAHLVGLPWVTVLLGASPGGISEMCITAKVLQLGVPVVTAFHVSRYVVVLLATAPLFRWSEARRSGASRSGVERP